MPHSCQAYLVLTAGQPGSEPKEVVRVLQHPQISCVLLQLGISAPDRSTVLEPLVRAIQSQSIAALIAGDAALAISIGADGVHLGKAGDLEAARTAYVAARQVLGDKRIVGVACGDVRHDAMTLAELGADYVALGDGSDPEGRLAMVGWWSELFSVPCVAWDVADPQSVRPLVDAGADFIATGPQSGLPQAAETLRALALVSEVGT